MMIHRPVPTDSGEIPLAIRRSVFAGMIFGWAALLTGCGPGAPSDDQAALQERGAQLFATCSACHSKVAGTVVVGPSLAGIVGRKAASMPNYKYSSALAASGVTWDETNLAKLLRDPNNFIPGMNMVLTPVEEKDIAAIIAHLKQLK
jgi:cytochrome c2